MIENLDLYLEQFKSKVLENGDQVHWARDSKEVCELILQIRQNVDAKTVTKGKSMVYE